MKTSFAFSRAVLHAYSSGFNPSLEKFSSNVEETTSILMPKFFKISCRRGLLDARITRHFVDALRAFVYCKIMSREEEEEEEEEEEKSK